MIIAVTGGSGFVGSHVVEALLARAYTVRCLVLPGEKPIWLDPRAVEFVEGDLRKPETLGPLVAGCDAIVHVAGLTRARRSGEFQAVNTDGTRALIARALDQPKPPRHVIAISSIAAAGPAQDSDGLAEDAPLRPLTAYGRSKADMESAIAGFAGRIDYTIIRAPTVYGPRDRDVLKYFRLIANGLRLIVADGSMLSILYVKSLASAVASCLLSPPAYRQIFALADDGVYDWDQFASMIEQALGSRTRRLRVPGPVLSALAATNELLRPLAPSPPLFTKDKLVDVRQRYWVVSSAKAKHLIGYTPLAASGDAIAETVAWYRSEGWL